MCNGQSVSNQTGIGRLFHLGNNQPIIASSRHSVLLDVRVYLHSSDETDETPSPSVDRISSKSNKLETSSRL